MDEQFENNTTSENISEEIPSNISEETPVPDTTTVNEPSLESLETQSYDNSKNSTDKEKDTGIGKEIWEWVYTILIALAITFFIKYCIFDVVRVDGPSMFPTLQNNDRLIVTKLGYTPNAGDIIILDSAYKKREEYIDSIERTTGKEMNLFDKITFQFQMPDYLKKRYYVKRIIALPGQTVDFTDDGAVLIDGKVLEEEYYQGVTRPTDVATTYPITVGEDMVFVMGDNRSVSKDSRSSELGQVPFDAIMGKAKVRIWPIADFATFK